jgi:hypothetical protein
MHYILCLDTDHYAGNFERETTAFATGQVGDCNVGLEFVEEFLGDPTTKPFHKEIQDKILLLDVAGDHSFSHYCPTGLETTPGYVNDGMGHVYKQDAKISPTPEQTEVYRQSHRDYDLPHIESAKRRLALGVNGWTQEHIDKMEERLQEKSAATITWFPAFHSVGIFFSRKPSKALINFIVERVQKFYARPYGWKKDLITLEGVRLLKVLSAKSKKEIPLK